ETITPANLPAWLPQGPVSGPKGPVLPPAGGHWPDSGYRSEKEARFIKKGDRDRYLEALQTTQYRGTGRWNVSAAARHLGMPRETLTYHLRKLRLVP
ncbi:MAG: hypothetical protein C0407_18165, partial [Desulfobacca sp.]|nr:hypothetical protein [Desulfobacca sp.]